MGMGWGEHGPAQTCPGLWVGQVAESPWRPQCSVRDLGLVKVDMSSPASPLLSGDH